MSKVGKQIIKGLQEALDFAKGDADKSQYRVTIPEEIDVKAIRKKLGMSQSEFAKFFGFNVRTLQDWEQGRRVPTGATRNYITLIQRDPEAVRDLLIAE